MYIIHEIRFIVELACRVHSANSEKPKLDHAVDIIDYDVIVISMIIIICTKAHLVIRMSVDPSIGLRYGSK